MCFCPIIYYRIFKNLFVSISRKIGKKYGLIEFTINILPLNTFFKYEIWL